MTETEICNLAIARIGGNRINDYQNDATAEGRNCRLLFWHTANTLLSSFDWPFARARSELSASTDTPDFEWDYQYVLPSNFLSMRHNYTESESAFPDERWEIEGQYLMTNDSEVELKYTKKVTDTTMFSPLFIELLSLHLAQKLAPKVLGTSVPTFMDELNKEIANKTNKTRTKILQESNTSGRSDWNYARYGSNTA